MHTIIKAAVVSALLMISTVCSFPTRVPNDGGPVSLADSARVYGTVPLKPITFMGALTPNGPVVNISGTFKEIYHAIQATNPEYLENNERLAKENASQGHELSKRWEQVHCAQALLGDWDNAYPRKPSPMDDAIKHLEGFGNAFCIVEADDTSVFFCEGKDAVIVTNTLDHQIAPPCSDFLYATKKIYAHCKKTGLVSHHFNGLIKHDRGDYVVSVYGVGGHDSCIPTGNPWHSETEE